MKLCGISSRTPTRGAPTSAWNLPVLAQHDAAGRGEALDQPEAGVVPRALVLLAGVAQPDDETDQLLLLFLLALVGGGLLASLRRGYRRPSRRPCRRLCGGTLVCPRQPLRHPSRRRPARWSARRPRDRSGGCAASSSSVMSCGTTTVATTGFSLLCSDSSTPFGSASSRTWIDLPTARLLEVDLDELRQVVREADDVELVQHVVDDAALLLHAGRLLGVDEVQRHLHVDLLVLGDALEVDVLHLRPERMHVHRAQQHLLLRAADVERQDRGVEALVPQVEVQRPGGRARC